MAFWSESGVEPKRTFRWLLKLPTIGQEWICKSVQRPSWETSMIPHKFINHEFKYPGRVTWNPINIVLVDPVEPIDTTASMLAILRASGYNFPGDEQEARSTITKKQATAALGQIQIDTLGTGADTEGADGASVVDSWTLVNPFATSVTLGDLNYDSEDMLEISFTVEYDYAYMTTAGGTPGGWSTGLGTHSVPDPAKSNSKDSANS